MQAKPFALMLFLSLAPGIVLLRLPPAEAAPIPANPDRKPADGVYLLPDKGEGRTVSLTDGSPVLLGKRLSSSIGTATRLLSTANDNSTSVLTLKGLGPLPVEVTRVQTALVVDGLVFHLGRPVKLADDGTATVSTNVETEQALKKLAARYRIEPTLRKHPGHRYEVRWTPKKARFATGEAVTVTMELKNTGKTPMRFTFGGKQRGSRNNQFRFIAQIDVEGVGLADTGNANHFGGKTMSKLLKPGEVFTTEVDLTKWFTFEEGNYRITGVFEMPVIASDSDNGFDPVVWDDLAVGECTVRIAPGKK